MQGMLDETDPLNEKILFGSVPHLTDPEIRKMLVKGMFGNKNSTFHSGP